MEKITHRQIVDYRLRYLAEQDGKCALCGEELYQQEAVLDHCHKTGRLRSVLHRGCNALLGKIENNMPRNRVNTERLNNICDRLVEYITTPRADIIHPTFKTAEERAMAQRGKKKKKNMRGGSRRG